jgi:hypothetical protein
MTTNFTEEGLEKVEVPVVEIRKHQDQLRRELLTSTHWDRKPSLLSILVKGGATNMKLKKLALLGMALAVIMGGVFAAAGIKSQDSTAYAKEMTQKSLIAFNGLGSEEKKAMEDSLNADIEQLLAEAKSAKDATVLTYDQAKDLKSVKTIMDKAGSIDYSVDKNVPMDKPNNNMQESFTKDLQTAKYLQFTSSKGEHVLIALGQDDLPLIITED